MLGYLEFTLGEKAQEIFDDDEDDDDYDDYEEDEKGDIKKERVSFAESFTIVAKIVDKDSQEMLPIITKMTEDLELKCKKQMSIKAYFSKLYYTICATTLLNFTT